jgi:hypothetical protein
MAVIRSNPSEVLLAAARSTLDVNKVDIKEETPPTVTRGGTVLVPPTVNPVLVNQYIDTLIPLDRASLLRVISQSVPANTRVAKGTAIDIVLVKTSDIRLDLIDNIHDDLKNKMVSDVLAVPAIQSALDAAKGVLDAHPDATGLTDADKKTITDAAKGAGMTVDEGNTGKTFAKAFASLQTLRTFQ